MSIQKIAVLTSGGDAPGMNAAVRAVTRTALKKGVQVMGVIRGYNGLIHNNMIELTEDAVSGKIRDGGTFLYTARCPEFREEAGIQKAVQVCRDNGIDGVVVIGGDGSFRGAQDLTRHGVPCVAMPGTIDNDISSCEETIGYDTAINTCIQMVDRLDDTTMAHDRCSVVEIMGRGCGDLALETAIAVGATAVCVPEIPFDFDKDVLGRIQQAKANGRTHFIIVVAEGVGGVVEMAKKIEEVTGIETRGTILGHVQRGGSPSARDRILSSRMGYYAVNILLEGKSNRVVATKQNDIVDYDIEEALSMKKSIDMKMYEMFNVLAQQ